MKTSYNDYLELLKSDKETLLKFLKARFPLFHNSNFFFRDLQYGIKSYLEKKNYKVTYKQSEDLAKEMASLFEKESLFIMVNSQAWRINNPEFIAAAPGDPF